ncbi:Transcription factor Sp4 [Thelohanellus kitauei]|uniref:Transcription factor Sp4 n=1 Tax=Thelohanellus kitauei TaxID=669202 RepID=A0A0C2JI34_THEKT|nr:Transcription factor Sp4 [Thelohanellus kitauei]
MEEHQSYRVYIENVCKIPHVCYDISNNATDITFDSRYSFIKEPIEFDENLFTDIIRAKKRGRSARGKQEQHEEKFRCLVDKCRRVYMSKQYLENHYLTHCKIKPFKCNVINCKARYFTKSDLQDHLSTHPDATRYKCPFCDFVAGEIKTMDGHVVIHKELDQNSADV